MYSQRGAPPPTEPATMPGRTVVQWDKDGLESTGIVKIDVLGLRMLAAVAEAVRLVEARSGEKLDLDRLPFTDDKVFTAITDADTIEVFQGRVAGADDRAAASQAGVLQRPGHLDQPDPPRSRAGVQIGGFVLRVQDDLHPVVDLGDQLVGIDR